MKNYLIITFILLFIFSSCNTNEKRKNHENENVPEAFQDESFVKDVSSSFKRGYSSVTEKLYLELLEKDESLKALEEKIKKLEEDLYNDNRDLYKFFSNNDEYYSEIKTQTEIVKDSLLKDILVQKIDESENNYREKIKTLKTLKEILDYNTDVLNDYRTAMKIILTEQSMQDYQDNFKQDTAALHSLIQRYISVKDEIKTKIE